MVTVNDKEMATLAQKTKEGTKGVSLKAPGFTMKSTMKNVEVRAPISGTF